MIGFPFDSHVTYETDGTPVYDRAISSEPLRNLLHKLFTDGILPDVSTNLQVVAGSGMNIVVKAGFAIVQGCLKLEENDRTLALQASSVTNDRIDTVVLRLNSNDDQRYCDLYIREGTPATNPTRPNLVRSDSVYELGLADIFVTKTITSITQSKITDTRYEAERCGVISSLSEYDTTTIYSQVQADLKEFKANEQADFISWYETIIDMLNDKAGNFTLFRNATLSTSWDYDKTNGYYTQDVLVAGIKATDKPVLDVVTSGSASNIVAIRKEWSKILQADTYDGGIKFYAKSATTKNLTVVIKPELSKITVNNINADDNLDVIIPKNAGARNAIYRGKFLGNSVTDEQYTAIKNGTFDDLFIGDYWTIGNINYRIAGFDYYLKCGDTATNKHHAVIVPDTCLYYTQMNNTSSGQYESGAVNTTAGGYVGSDMYKSNLEQAKVTIKSAFIGHVLKHRIYLTNAVANGRASGGAWCDSEVDLMCEQMVYGSGIFSPASDGSSVPANYRVEKSQLPLFQHEPSHICNRVTWWLRDVITASNFACVGNPGYADYDATSRSLGVRPAFCIYGG